MKLYTRTGDDGDTGLIGGARVPKDHARVDCYGMADELNATLGLAAILCAPDWQARVQAIQNDLFVLGTELATAPGGKPIVALDGSRIPALEAEIDDLMAPIPPLQNFVLPGGSELAARFHLARTVCRRTERAVVALSHGGGVNILAVTYLNRLGDLLFAYALAANWRAGVADVLWKSR